MSDVPLLSYQVWIGLPQETRSKLARLFIIPKTGESVVRVGAIIGGNIAGESTSDGYTAKDLYAISTEKMQALIGTDDTDFYAMFNFVVENVDDLLSPKETIIEEIHKEKKALYSMVQIIKEKQSIDLDPKEKKNFSKLMDEKPKEYKKRGRPSKNEKKEQI